MKEEKKTTEDVENKDEKVEKVNTKKEENTETTNKKSGKKIILITIITLVVIIASAVGGYFAYDYYERNKSVGTDWGDTYVTYLEEAKQASQNERFSKYGIIEGAENTTIQFCQIREESDPSMVIKYETRGNKFLTVWDINDEQNNPDVQVQFDKEDIKLLYNVEKQDYEWYYYQNYDGGYSYTEVVPTSDNTTSEGHKMHKVYDFKEADMPKNEEVKEGEVPTISKFEETFIVPEVEESKQINIDLNGDIKDIKKAVTETVEEFKTEEEIITEEVKTQIEEGKTELNNKKEEIKKAEEEKKRQEEEARKKAEEEARKKAEEEAKKGLKVGNYTLKYGKYTFSMDDGFAGRLTGTITLQANGQFYIKSNFDESSGSVGSGLDCAGTYTVQLNVATGSPGDYSDGIRFKTNTGKTFFHEVISNNGFSDQWHGYTYAGN